MRDSVYVVGHGKLASKIQNEFQHVAEQHQIAIKSVDNWDNFPASGYDSSRIVFIHVGSGRQLREVITCCETHHIPLIQGATGMVYPENLSQEMKFVYVDAPNLSIPITKFLYMLEEMGSLFREYDIAITESHQSTKVSLPGTALAIAKSLQVEPSHIKSIRDTASQQESLGIPSEYLNQHAIHVIDIVADKCKISLKTEVYGLETYLLGLVDILQYIEKLSPGKYKLTDLIRGQLI